MVLRADVDCLQLVCARGTSISISWRERVRRVRHRAGLQLTVSHERVGAGCSVWRQARYDWMRAAVGCGAWIDTCATDEWEKFDAAAGRAESRDESVWWVGLGVLICDLRFELDRGSHAEDADRLYDLLPDDANLRI